MEIHFNKLLPSAIHAHNISYEDRIEDDLVVLIGFQSGDIVLWHVFDCAYVRFNKQVQPNNPFASYQLEIGCPEFLPRCIFVLDPWIINSFYCFL